MNNRCKVATAFLTMAALTGPTAVSAADANIWSTTFEDPVNPYYESVGPWVNVDAPNLLMDAPALASVPGGSPLAAVFGGSYLQGSGLDYAIFMMSGVGLGTGVQPITLHLQFDLAFEDGWDAVGGDPATEGFAFSFDGTPILWNASNAFGTGAGGPGTILSTGSDLLGDANLMDTVVHYDFVFQHNMPSILLGFQTQGVSFGPLANTSASWGLDNFSLAAVTADENGDDGSDGGSVTPGAVPEAPTWTMLLAGFAVIGAASRRRRQANSAL